MTPATNDNSDLRFAGRISPRLLSKIETAHYLGYRSTANLSLIPIKPIRLSEVGGGTSPRYDRHALDRWLDGLSGPAQAPTAIAGSDSDGRDENPWDELVR